MKGNYDYIPTKPMGAPTLCGPTWVTRQNNIMRNNVK